MKKHAESIYPVCPKCSGSAKIFNEHWGNAYSARCGNCGWEGDTRNIEATVRAAIEAWDEKAKLAADEQNSNDEQKDN